MQALLALVAVIAFLGSISQCSASSAARFNTQRSNGYKRTCNVELNPLRRQHGSGPRSSFPSQRATATIPRKLHQEKAETTEGFQKTIRPIAEACKASVKATDDDVETVVHLKKDVTPEGKCLMACVMEKIGMMRNGTMASEEEILKPYRAIFADDPRRLSKAEEVVHNCRVEALQKFPTQTCDMAHVAVFCTIVRTY